MVLFNPADHCSKLCFKNFFYFLSVPAWVVDSGVICIKVHTAVSNHIGEITAGKVGNHFFCYLWPITQHSSPCPDHRYTLSLFSPQQFVDFPPHLSWVPSPISVHFFKVINLCIHQLFLNQVTQPPKTLSVHGVPSSPELLSKLVSGPHQPPDFLCNPWEWVLSNYCTHNNCGHTNEQKQMYMESIKHIMGPAEYVLRAHLTDSKQYFQVASTFMLVKWCAWSWK